MLRDDINNAVKDAMKAKDERKLSTLRMVNSTIKNADIEAHGEGKPPLSDADLLGVFQKMIKQRQESVELYDKGGREELAGQGARGDRYHLRLFTEADVGGRREGGDRRRRSRRPAPSGMKDMGKVMVPEGELCRADGFRQGHRSW